VYNSSIKSISTIALPPSRSWKSPMPENLPHWKGLNASPTSPILLLMDVVW